LLWQYFPSRIDLYGSPQSEPKQGFALFELTPANEISPADTYQKTLSKCCIDPLRPPRLSECGPDHLVLTHVHRWRPFRKELWNGFERSRFCGWYESPSPGWAAISRQESPWARSAEFVMRQPEDPMGGFGTHSFAFSNLRRSSTQECAYPLGLVFRANFWVL
jgi:hypothetical protein